jgi:hypothetical protein
MSKKGYKQTQEHKEKRALAMRVIMKGRHNSPKTEFKKGMVSALKGKKLSFVPKGAFKKGLVPWNKGLKGFRAGVQHHNWQGGITEENDRIRNSLEIKIWRRAVFERDNYTCVFCGIRSGNGEAVTLHADHIKPFALFPELRFAIDNGRTLCVECHKKTDTFAGRTRKGK